jgi:hypothetical protein
MTMEGTDSTPPASTSSGQTPSHRTKVLLAILGLAAMVAVLGWVSVAAHSRRSSRSNQRQICRDLQPGLELGPDEIIDSYDNDPFDFSIVKNKPGFLYSYKHQNTNETKGPKILVMTDSEVFAAVTNAYSWGLLNCYFCLQDSFYLLQLTIGKNSSEGGDVWAGLGNYEDVTVDPSVVHVRLSSNVSYMSPLTPVWCTCA